MAYSRRYFGTLFATKEDVEKVTITQGEYRFSVLSYGATLQEFSLHGKNIVVSSEKLSVYEPWKNHMGKVVGPFANRIAEGRFSIEGKSYQVEVNNGVNHLHSGSANIGAQNWTIDEVKEDAVTLLTTHQDGVGGFPGNNTFRVTYQLTKEGALTISYQATTDASCLMNLTNHAYFNLHGKPEDIRDHELWMDAPYYLQVDDGLIPISKEKTAKTAFDFSTPHPIGAFRDGIYDHCFVFGATKRASVVCENVCLSVETTSPAMQLYTGQNFSVSSCTGGDYGAFEGFALETSGYPDSPNHPEFPSCVLHKGEVYQSQTTYTLTEKKA